MIPDGLFNQTITLYSKSSLNRYGREVVGSGTDYNARVQETTKVRLLPNGQQVMIMAIVYLNNAVSVAVNDRVDFNSEKYKVFSLNKAVDGQGNTNHIKLELIKWQET